MSKFEVGDIIVRTSGQDFPEYGVKKGSTYEVSSYGEYATDMIRIKNSPHSLWDEDNFELLEPKKLPKNEPKSYKAVLTIPEGINTITGSFYDDEGVEYFYEVIRKKS